MRDFPYRSHISGDAEQFEKHEAQNSPTKDDVEEELVRASQKVFKDVTPFSNTTPNVLAEMFTNLATESIKACYGTLPEKPTFDLLDEGEVKCDMSTEIARGSFGSTYRCMYKGVPLVQKKAFYKGGVTEAIGACIMNQINHDYLMKTYDYKFLGNGQIVFLLEDCGTSLLKMYEDDNDTFQNLPFLKICIQIAKVLSQLHQQGVMHGDLAVRNVCWHSEKQCIKLIDAGYVGDANAKGFNDCKRLYQEFISPFFNHNTRGNDFNYDLSVGATDGFKVIQFLAEKEEDTQENMEELQKEYAQKKEQLELQNPVVAKLAQSFERIKLDARPPSFHHIRDKELLSNASISLPVLRRKGGLVYFFKNEDESNYVVETPYHESFPYVLFIAIGSFIIPITYEANHKSQIENSPRVILAEGDFINLAIMYSLLELDHTKSSDNKSVSFYTPTLRSKEILFFFTDTVEEMIS